VSPRDMPLPSFTWSGQCPRRPDAHRLISSRDDRRAATPRLRRPSAPPPLGSAAPRLRHPSAPPPLSSAASGPCRPARSCPSRHGVPSTVAVKRRHAPQPRWFAAIRLSRHSRTSPTAHSPDFCPAMVVPQRRRNKSGHQPLRHRPYRDLMAWMPHPGRMNNMAGTSTPYDAGAVRAAGASGASQWPRRSAGSAGVPRVPRMRSGP